MTLDDALRALNDKLSSTQIVDFDRALAQEVVTSLTRMLLIFEETTSLTEFVTLIEKYKQDLRAFRHKYPRDYYTYNEYKDMLLQLSDVANRFAFWIRVHWNLLSIHTAITSLLKDDDFRCEWLFSMNDADFEIAIQTARNVGPVNASKIVAGRRKWRAARKS